MRREKQIEEMAKILCGMKNGCDGCMFSKVYCNERNYAEEIYNAGYRKQNVGEWVAYPDEHEICATEFVCSNCKDSFCTNEMTDWQFIETMKFCPNCGARMKGGAE